MCRYAVLHRTATLMVGLCALVVWGLHTYASPRTTAESGRSSPLSYDWRSLRTGDVIFRRGLSVVSNIVLAADQRLPYSHVGIVIVEDPRVWIVHASPDEPQGSDGSVMVEQLSEFLGPDRASAAAVYRTGDHISAGRAAATAREYAKHSLPFDRAFDLSTADSLYCTELVWRAYLAAGVDLTGGATESLPILLGRGPYLLPGTLLAGHFLRPVSDFTSSRTP